MADNRTLDEIKANDDSNFQEVMDACVNQVFPSTVYAYQYRMHCVEQAIQDLGFSPQKYIELATSAETASELIDQALVSRNIRLEDWSEHAEKDRRGMAIYKDNEIAFFIALVRQSGGQFIVKSNVKFS